MKKMTIFFSIIILCFMAIWFASPYWTLYQIKQAIDQNQADNLSQYIDYPRVRQSLKLQIQQQLNHKLGFDNSNNQLATWGVVLSEKLTEQLVDVAVNPQSIQLLMQGKALRDSIVISKKEEISPFRNWLNKAHDFLNVDHSSQDDHSIAKMDSQNPINIVDKKTEDNVNVDISKSTKNRNPQAQAHYLSLNQFEVIVPNDDGEQTHFIMQRNGLNWKIIKILVNFS